MPIRAATRLSQWVVGGVDMLPAGRAEVLTYGVMEDKVTRRPRKQTKDRSKNITQTQKKRRALTSKSAWSNSRIQLREWLVNRQLGTRPQGCSTAVVRETSRHSAASVIKEETSMRKSSD